MTTQRHTDAPTAYAYHQGVALHLLARARLAFDAHAVAAAGRPKDWGFVGDVEAATGKLLEALAALDAVSPMEREGLRL